MFSVYPQAIVFQINSPGDRGVRAREGDPGGLDDDLRDPAGVAGGRRLVLVVVTRAVLIGTRGRLGGVRGGSVGIINFLNTFRGSLSAVPTSIFASKSSFTSIVLALKCSSIGFLFGYLYSISYFSNLFHRSC